MARTALTSLALAAALFAGAGPAGARATLESPGGDGALVEADHALSLQLDGPIAIAESVQTIVNRGKRAREAIYTFELPGDAAVTDVSIRLADGRVATATTVDAEAAVRFGTEDQVIDAEPDIGLLRLVERREADPFTGAPAIATYELRVWPVEAGRAVVVSTSWVAPLRYDDGRLSLRIPGRDIGGALAAEDVTLAITPPAGARGIGEVRGGGRTLGKRRSKPAKRASHRFTAPAAGDLVVEYVPELGARAPHALVSYASAPIDRRRGVVAVAVLAPPPAPSALPEYERVVVVLDLSRSMSRAGVDAAGEMVGAVLDAAGHGAEIEVVVFDRTARRLFGELKPNERAQREAIARAVASAPLDNGSDLGAALDEVRALFDALPEPQGRPRRDGVTRGLGPTTLVAIVSDGMVPLELTADRAADRIGTRALAEAEVLAVTIVPDEAPTPDTTSGPLAALARKTGGRSIAVWTNGAERRARQLTAELARPPAIELPSVEVPRGTAIEGLALPPAIEPGRGALAIASYRGRPPARLAVEATVKGQQIRLTGKRAGKRAAQAALRLWLAAADREEFIAEADRIDPEAGGVQEYDERTLARAERAMLEIAERAPFVGKHTALVANDPSDQFSKERLAFTEKWGPSLFFRVPPPPEQQAGHELRELSIVAAPGGAAHPSWRPTGELDFDIVARLMRTYVLPKAQICYQRALRKQPRLAGTLTLVVEIARGEVQEARIDHSTLAGDAVEPCVLDAAYTIRVPRVALGDDTEYIGVARYPIKFRRVGKRGTASKGDPPSVGRDPDDPLDGLPDEP